MFNMENVQSLVSYTIGGGTLYAMAGDEVVETVSKLAELAATSQHLAMIGAFVLVLVRLAYDALRLWRSIKQKDKDE